MLDSREKAMIETLTEITTKWDSKYNTNSDAKVTGYRRAKNVTAIEIKNGFYRGSEVNGIFEVANPEDPIKERNGKLKVEVLCGWFGMKPRTTWIHIMLTGKWELLDNYSGEVALNLTSI